MTPPKRAFTLMELLVVIAILGILISITIPAFSAARAIAQRAGCKATLKSVGNALAMYLTNNRDRYPRVANLPSEIGSEFPSLPEALQDYLGASVVKCPADSEGVYEPDGSSYEFNLWLCGKALDDKWVGELMGEIYTQVVWDYYPFHGEPGTDLCINFLYADGSVKGLGED